MEVRGQGPVGVGVGGRVVRKQILCDRSRRIRFDRCGYDDGVCASASLQKVSSRNRLIFQSLLTPRIAQKRSEWLFALIVRYSPSAVTTSISTT